LFSTSRFSKTIVLSAVFRSAERPTDAVKVEMRGRVDPALVCSANLLITKVGLILTAIFVAFSISTNFDYRTIVLFLFLLKRTISNPL
jgi:hypothetical protein